MTGPSTSVGARDGGFTLTELLVAVVVTGLILPVIVMAIVVSLRTLPSTTDRADAAVAAQGIATWLPADVDSTEPGGIDVDPATPSGCQGVDPGRNVLRLTWTETFRGTTVHYVAAYRFVARGEGAHIVRLACSGSPKLGPAATISMSGLLSTNPPRVTVLDVDGDGLSDRVRLAIETRSETDVFIDAVSKNPGEFLASPPAATTPVTTISVPNQPPSASPVNLAAHASVPVVVNLPVSDPDGDPLVVSLSGVPSGWVAVPSGTSLTVTPSAPPGARTFGYTVTDPAGASVSSTVTITVTTSATTTSTSTTTTTTVPPPCVLSGMSVSPSTVSLSAKGTGKLKRNVRVTISIESGYCVGLTLQYETGAPNGQYVQNLGNTPPYAVTLVGQPNGTELWAVGLRELVVRDGTGTRLASRTLTVTD